MSIYSGFNYCIIHYNTDFVIYFLETILMSNTMCFFHPNTITNTTCDKCHRAICTADHRRYTRGGGYYSKQLMFCPECYDKTKSGDKRWNMIGLISAIIVLSIIGALFYYLFNYT